MIDIFTLVDKALSANTEAYKDSFRQSLEWEQNHTDYEYAEKWACTFRHEYRAIADTLIRLFPDHEGYISDYLTVLRLQVQHFEIDENKEVA